MLDNANTFEEIVINPADQIVSGKIPNKPEVQSSDLSDLFEIFDSIVVNVGKLLLNNPEYVVFGGFVLFSLLAVNLVVSIYYKLSLVKRNLQRREIHARGIFGGERVLSSAKNPIGFREEVGNAFHKNADKRK